jgi:hypothetical protein
MSNPGGSVKKSGSEERIKEQTFLNTLSEITIHGKPVSVSIGNPKLDDNPLIGVSEGFELLTGYKNSEIIGRNCRFLNDGCTVTREQRTRMHAAVYEGAECVEILDNAKKSGEPFKNLLHLRTLDISGRKYIIGIQSLYAGPPGEEEYVRTVGNQREIQVVLDRIFQMDVAGWADRQLTKFCVTSPLPWFRSQQSGGMHWRPLDQRTANANLTVQRGTTAGVDAGAFPVPEGFHSSPDDPRAGEVWSAQLRAAGAAGYPAPLGHAPVEPQILEGASSSDPYRGISYNSNQGQVISVGQKVDWMPELRGHVGLGSYSVAPPLPSGLYLEPETGRILGVVASCTEPWEWTNYTVTARCSGQQYSTMLQVKVIDLVQMQIEHISQCRGDKYAVVFKVV